MYDVATSPKMEVEPENMPWRGHYKNIKFLGGANMKFFKVYFIKMH